jgi:chromate transporter
MSTEQPNTRQTPDQRTGQRENGDGEHEPARAGDVVAFRDAVRAWFIISLQTFGGPAGQIAVMQRELVEERRWIGQRRFLHALSYCTLLPGPEAQQLAIYVGWLLNGVRGGLVAGALFVLPGMVALLGLSAMYLAAGDSTFVVALFAGLAPAVLVIVAQAVVRVGKRALGHPALVALAVAAFVTLTGFAVPFPLVIAAAAGIGWTLGRWAPATMHTASGPGAADDGPAPLISDEALHQEPPSRLHTVQVLAVGLVAWLVPVGLVVAFTGADSVFVSEIKLFSLAAIVTFGGAYAVLAYVAHQAVVVYGWLAPGEMVRGLALAESTPGPLIMVTQFVGAVGAFRNPPGDMNPWVAALIGSLLVTLVTFVPSFTLVFLGAPYVERLRGNHALSAALTGVTAAVVGVIANLAVFFAETTLFGDVHAVAWGPLHLQVPDPTSLKPFALCMVAVAAVLLFRLRWSTLRTLGVCALLGVAAALIGLPVT